MAVVVHYATATQVALLIAIKTLIDAGSAGGKIKFYTAPMPASANDAPTGATLLATCTFSATCASDPVTGTMTFSAITKDSSVDDDGVTTWARITDSDDNTILDTNVATADAGINLVSTTLAAGTELTISAGTCVMPSGE